MEKFIGINKRISDTERGWRTNERITSFFCAIIGCGFVILDIFKILMYYKKKNRNENEQLQIYLLERRRSSRKDEKTNEKETFDGSCIGGPFPYVPHE